MYCVRNVTDEIFWVGGNDRRLALFENIFPIPRGVSYNSYLILDEKTALIDTVDFAISRQFFENIDYILNNKSLDYLVVNHMEPDHCANIAEIIKKFPNVKLILNSKTIPMINQFFDIDLTDKIIVVKEGDEISLGKHTLKFFMAPMVHWPEVMVTYEISEKVLFSADGFGTFGALNGNLFNDEVNFDKDWIDEARRYYTNIVGKYGAQVQALLKKALTLEIKIICPLHGLVWRNNLEYIIEKYDKWSSYISEDENAVLIAYASIYGNTENVANIIANEISKKGIKNIAIYDVSNTHVSTLISEAFRCSHIILATPTYNGGIYPIMENFLSDMKALNLQNKKIGVVDNGTWASTAGKQVIKMLEQMKNMTIINKTILIKSTLKENQLNDVNEFIEELLN